MGESCKCEHQQSFVGLNDEKGGMLIANIGLYEYEILPEEKNALAVTILRSVGELGDWGVFPTELSQQLRHITAEYEMTFFAGIWLKTTASEAHISSGTLYSCTDQSSCRNPAG